MKNKIDGYCNFEIIKGYQRLGDKLIISYMDGRCIELTIKAEDLILEIMEEQGREYARGLCKKKGYLCKVVGASSLVVVLFFGSLYGMEQLCSNVGVSNLGYVGGVLVGGLGIGFDSLLARNIFKDLAVNMGKFGDQEKYEYYYRNKVILDNYININDLDNYSFNEVQRMVAGKKLKKVRKAVRSDDGV